jgi:hypothetical protein
MYQTKNNLPAPMRAPDTLLCKDRAYAGLGHRTVRHRDEFGRAIAQGIHNSETPSEELTEG